MATSNSETDERMSKWSDKTPYEKLNRLLGEFGYVLSFQNGDHQKVAQATSIIIGNGFIVQKRTHQGRAQVNERWFKQMAQYIYGVPQNEWKFDRLLVKHEFANILYQCTQHQDLKLLVEKDDKSTVSKARWEKLMKKVNSLSYMNRLNDASKIIINGNGLNDPQFADKWKNVMDALFSYLNLEFDEPYQVTADEESKLVTFFQAIVQDCKMKKKRAKKLEETKITDSQTKERYQAERTQISEYLDAAILADRFITEMRNFNKNQSQDDLLSHVSANTISQSLVSGVSMDSSVKNPQAFLQAARNIKGKSKTKKNGIRIESKNNTTNEEDIKTEDENEVDNDDPNLRSQSLLGNEANAVTTDRHFSQFESQNENVFGNHQNNSLSGFSSHNFGFGSSFGNNNNNNNNENNSRALTLEEQIIKLQKENERLKNEQKLQQLQNENANLRGRRRQQYRDESVGLQNQHQLQGQQQQQQHHQIHHSMNTFSQRSQYLNPFDISHQQQYYQNQFQREQQPYAIPTQPSMNNTVYSNQSSIQASQTINKAEINAMFKFDSKFNGEGRDVYNNLIKFVEDVRSWWRIYKFTVQERTAIKRLLSFNISGKAKLRILDRHELIPFLTVKQVLKWLLKSYGGDEHYKMMEKTLVNWQVPNGTEVSLIVSLYKRQVRNYHEALELSQLSMELQEQLKWPQEKQFLMLLKCLDLNLKQEIITLYGKPTSMETLQETLEKIDKQHNWLKGTSSQILDKPDVGNVPVNKVSINKEDVKLNEETDFNINYSTQYDRYRFGRTRDRGNRRFNNFKQNYYEDEYEKKKKFDGNGRYFSPSRKKKWQNRKKWRQFNPEFGTKIDHSNDKKFYPRCYKCNSQ